MDDRNLPKPNVTNLTTAQVRERCRRNPLEKALEFTYETPIRKLTARTAHDMTHHAISSVRKWRREDPEASDDALRDRLIAESEGMRLFATNSHPKLFRNVTDRSASVPHLKRIQRMLETQMQIEEGRVPNAESAVRALQDSILRDCSKR